MRLSSQRGTALLLLAVATAVSVGTATDPDLWWHLRTGEVIVNDGLPRADPFSFTVPGSDWITHEWGAQVLMWGLWSLSGSTALIVAFAALVGAALLMAHATSRARPVLTASVALLAGLAAHVATAPRPQMFNLVLLAALILVLERVRQERLDARWAWAAVPLVAIWANLHSGYLLGIVTLGVYAVGERFELRRSGGRPLPGRIVGRLPVITGVAALAALANPSGPAMWRYPIDTLRSSAMRTYIQEWHSPDFHDAIYYPFIALLALSVVSLLASPRRPGWTQGLLLFGTAVAGLQSIRHIPIFAIVAIPIVAEQAEVALDAARARHATRTRSAVLGPLTAGLGAVIVALVVATAVANNDRVVAETYPVAATDLILESELAGQPGFNAYGWGGYLIWRDLPVFIDGRADVYGDEFIEYYMQAEDARASWRRPLDDYDVSWVLLRPGAELGVVLAEAPEWTSVYEDGVAEVFVRCTADCPVLEPVG